MNRGPDKWLHDESAASCGDATRATARQIGSGDATSAPIAQPMRGHVLLDAPFMLLAPLLALIARIYFHRLVGVGLERFGTQGPALLLANHPAAWTDALVLDVVLRRKVHFVAEEKLFHPWARGVFLRLFGSLPIAFGHDEAAVRCNRRTFARCQQILSQGGAVGFFPEGVSDDDRTLRPLKHGAARLVVERMLAGAALPPLVPVALFYEDRTAFRRDVTVVVGATIAPPAPQAVRSDAESEAHALTARFTESLQRSLADAAQVQRVRSGGGPIRAPAVLRVAALLGRAAHAIPIGIVESVVRRRHLPPQQIALARISLGTVLILSGYLGLAVLALYHRTLLALLPVMPALGALACHEYDLRRLARGPGENRP